MPKSPAPPTNTATDNNKKGADAAGKKNAGKGGAADAAAAGGKGGKGGAKGKK